MLKVSEIVNGDFLKLVDLANTDDFASFELGPIQFDSRVLKKGETFVALKGARDGHEFLAAAKKAGAKAFIVEKEGWDSLEDDVRKEVSKTGPCLVVQDTLEAIARLAAKWRSQFAIPVLSVGGSNGKTTTKDMVATILREVIEPKGSILSPEGSFNNEIGIPCIVSRLSKVHKAAVLEIGGNDFGEIRAMTKVAAPTGALITNIGDDHLEFFRDRRGVFQANWEMIEELPEPEGVWFVNRDDPILRRAHENLDRKLNSVTYSIRDSKADYYAGILDKLGEEGNFGYRVRFSGEKCVETVEALLKFPGIHNVQNALAAFSVAVEFYGCDPVATAEALERVEFSKYRSEIIRLTEGALIFNDCYNANPSSFDAALKMVHDATNGEFWVAVGDFLEVGGNDEEVHRLIGDSAARSGAKGIGASGNFAKYVVEGAVEAGMSEANCKAVKSPDKLKTFFIPLLRGGGNLLVKGSRGAQMEKLVSEITSELG